MAHTVEGIDSLLDTTSWPARRNSSGRAFVLALLASLLVHAAGLSTLPDRLVEKGKIQIPGKPLQLRVRKVASVTAGSTSDDASAPDMAESALRTTPTPAEKHSTLPSEVVSPAPETEAASVQTPGSPVDLDISTDTLRAIAREQNAESEARPSGLSGNGSTIFSDEVRAALGRAPQRGFPETASPPPTVDGSFSDGRWTDYVNMGGRCFRVVRADPLTPMSVEMWFPVDCDR